MDKAIKILNPDQINKASWDACVRNSSNSLIYAFSFYLDAICENWSGIILNDYEAVMPVPWKKKFGIIYCYEVPFIQQLGWFSNNEDDFNDVFLSSLFKKWKYGDYAFNFNNQPDLPTVINCSNYIMDLSRAYSEISLQYTTSFCASLKKAGMQSLIYESDTDYIKLILLSKELYNYRIPHVTDKDYQKFESVCRRLSEQKNIIIRKVTADGGKLMAASLLLKDEKRIYNLINCVTEEGRKAEANYFLYDQMFREFSGSGLIFDFEGSDIPGVKSFYEKFGAIDQPYKKLHFNHLLFPLKLIKQ